MDHEKVTTFEGRSVRLVLQTHPHWSRSHPYTKSGFTSKCRGQELLSRSYPFTGLASVKTLKTTLTPFRISLPLTKKKETRILTIGRRRTSSNGSVPWICTKCVFPFTLTFLNSLSSSSFFQTYCNKLGGLVGCSKDFHSVGDLKR